MWPKVEGKAWALRLPWRRLEQEAWAFANPLLMEASWYEEEQLSLIKGTNKLMSEVALSTSKVRWLEKGARNCVVLATKARPCIPMHQVF